MPHSESTTPASARSALPQVGGRPIRREAKAVDLFHCLIVSADLPRQKMLARAAAEGGWETVVCSDGRTALSHASVLFLQMAIVDLDGQSCANGNAGEFDELLERLAPTKLLLLVCGNEGDTEEEIKIRQLGAWLYLPGVVETSDVSLLCTEARHIAERLHAMAQGTPRVTARVSLNGTERASDRRPSDRIRYKPN
jgi:ActR/RegA family two-component response regulator